MPRPYASAAALPFFAALALSACSGPTESESESGDLKVRSTYPQAYSAPAVDSTLEITFTQALEAESPSHPGLEVIGPPLGAPVPGAWSLAGGGRRLVFHPQDSLFYNARYTVKVPADLRSLGGKTLGEAFTLPVQTAPSPTASAPPVLRNLGIRLAPYDAATQRMGDVLLSSFTRKPFLEFGVVVKDFEGKDKALGEFTFIDVDSNAAVVSPIAGIVEAVEAQAHDIEVRVRPHWGSEWVVILDHVHSPQVKPGDKVAVGQAVALASRAFEISVGHLPGEGDVFVAPFRVFDPATSRTFQDQVWALMDSIEARSGHPEWYDQARMEENGAGCLAKELPAF